LAQKMQDEEEKTKGAFYAKKKIWKKL